MSFPTNIRIQNYLNLTFAYLFRKFQITCVVTTTVRRRTPDVWPPTYTGRSLQTTCPPSLILSKSVSFLQPSNFHFLKCTVNECQQLHWLKMIILYRSNVKALIPQPLLEKKPAHEWKQVTNWSKIKFLYQLKSNDSDDLLDINSSLKVVKEELVKTKGTNSDNAKLAFLKIIHQWPTYGSVFFTVKVCFF